MPAFTRIRALVAAVLALALVLQAQLTPAAAAEPQLIPYYLPPVTLSDGGTLTGSFTLDLSNKQITEAYFRSTRGSGLPGYTYINEATAPYFAPNSRVPSQLLFNSIDPVTRNTDHAKQLSAMAMNVANFDPAAAAVSLSFVRESDPNTMVARNTHDVKLVKGAPLPSLLVLANLANNVYSGDAGYGDYGAGILSCNVVPDTCDNWGFQAAAYATRDESEVVIAIRGTDVSDALTTVKNLAADASFDGSVANPLLRREVADAVQFVHAIREKYPRARLTLTGHSLGGGVAQLLGRLSYLPTSVFNAPGTASVLDDVFDLLLPIYAYGAIRAQQPSVNYRLWGDQISTLGVQIDGTSVVTILAPGNLGMADDISGDLDLCNNDPVCARILYYDRYANDIGFLHKMDTVLAQIASGATQVPNLQGPNVGSSLTSAIQPDGALAPVYRFTVRVLDATATADLPDVSAGKWVRMDPTSGNQFVLAGDVGSPMFGCIDLPALQGVALYNVRTAAQTGSEWSEFVTVQPAVPLCFDSGVNSIEFDSVDANQATVTVPAPFLFAVTFAAAGDFNGTLTVSSNG